MSSDNLVERLRIMNRSVKAGNGRAFSPLYDEAAGRIEQLERERDEARHQFDRHVEWASEQSLTAEHQRDAAMEALRVADDAIAEYIRYLDGGEMRGSYDGKPERNGLRKALAVTRQVLSHSSRTSP